MSPCVGTIVVVDGSPESDVAMKAACGTIGVRYDHAGHRISYVDGYNRGWRSLEEPYIALMANDILPHPPALERLLDWVKRPDVGCTFPYMCSFRLYADETQAPGFLKRGRVTCEPGSMTLNLNLFKRDVLEKIGGLDRNYLHGFNEPILLIKIRTLGYRAVMVGGTRVFHYEKLTKVLGQSTLITPEYETDTERWFEEYPHHASRKGIACLDLRRSPFATTATAKCLWWLGYAVPNAKFRMKVLAVILWLEPFFTRYPARHGGKA